MTASSLKNESSDLRSEWKKTKDQCRVLFKVRITRSNRTRKATEVRRLSRGAIVDWWRVVDWLQKAIWLQYDWEKLFITTQTWDESNGNRTSTWFVEQHFFQHLTIRIDTSPFLNASLGSTSRRECLSWSNAQKRIKHMIDWTTRSCYQ